MLKKGGMIIALMVAHIGARINVGAGLASALIRYALEPGGRKARPYVSATNTPKP